MKSAAALVGYDRICEITTSRIRAKKTLSPDLPAFRGHYPSRPVFPGVLILESMLQAAAHHALAVCAHPVYVSEIRSLRFFSPLLPGDTYTIDGSFEWAPEGMECRAQFLCHNNGTQAATARLVLRHASAPRLPDALAGNSVAPSTKSHDTPPQAAQKAEVLTQPWHPAQVRRCLPQRYPMLLVDRMLDFEPGKRAVATKCITLNEPCYAALADDATEVGYAYPVPLMIESFAQSAGALLVEIWRERLTSSQHVVMFGAIVGVTLHGVALPGDTMCHEITLDTGDENTAVVSGNVRVGDTVIARVQRIVAAVRDTQTSALASNQTG